MVIRKKERFEPVTLGHIRSHGCRDLLIYCGSINCNHSTTINADHLPDDTVIRALGPKMVCTKCAIAAPTFGRIGHHMSISGTFRAAQAARRAGAGQAKATLCDHRHRLRCGCAGNHSIAQVSGVRTERLPPPDRAGPGGAPLPLKPRPRGCTEPGLFLCPAGKAAPHGSDGRFCRNFVV